jgi:hypothetical protein
MRSLLVASCLILISVSSYSQRTVVQRTTSADESNPGSLILQSGPPLLPADHPLDLPQMLGWPKTMGTNPLYSPSGVALADITRDDTLEIIAGSTDGRLYAWDFKGNLLPGFPVTVGNRIQSPPAIGDIDGNGSMEIAVCNGVNVYVYKSDGTLLSGWPKPVLTNAFGFSAPVLYDLDGDGKLEVIQGSGSNSGNLGRIYIWKYDGSNYPGWPQTLGNNYRITSTVSVGDLDGDGAAEIIAVSTKGGGDTVKVFAYHRDSTQVAGWPYTAPNVSTSWSSAAIGNVNTTTSSREVLFIAANFFGGSGNLYCVNANGTNTPGFPVPLPFGQAYPSIVLGDVDRNGSLEIVCGGLYNDSRQYIFRNDGTVMPGWPQFFATNIEGTAILANVDASASMEVLNGDNFTVNGSFFGFTLDGSQAANFPLIMGGAMSVNSAAVGDVDRNGTMEIALVNGNGTVNLWATSRPFDTTKVEWGTFYHDNYRTNNYHFRPRVTSVPDLGSLPASFALYQNYPNPFNPVTTIRYSLPSQGSNRDKGRVGEGSNVIMKVFDLLGCEVATLVDERQDAGPHTVQFDASRLSSGVYFYRLQSGDKAESRAMILLR